jgi:mono/diheme cytochrome c family protein
LQKLSTIFKTILSLVVLAVVGVVAFIYSGLYDVSASTPDNPLIAWAFHATSEASVGARYGANKVPPGLDQPATIAAGGKLFVTNCMVCHGAPGVAPTNIARGLNPRPPDLFRATREPDVQENYQFIAHGVKMTGMPAFEATLGAERVWQLVAFLDKLPGISAADFASLTGAPAATPALPPAAAPAAPSATMPAPATPAPAAPAPATPAPATSAPAPAGN